MICFNCGIPVTQCKSKYGFYYFCPSCKNTFETSGQQGYNSKNYRNVDCNKVERIDNQIEKTNENFKKQ